jgi:predicted ATP-grasp superfamily ATP-dependent carboligase
VTHVLIAGLSARAAADSAVRAGFTVTTLDAFADRDLHPAVRGLSLPRDFAVGFSAQAAACAASDLPAEAAVYTSTFENDPDAVRTLAAGRVLWGNRPSVLRRVRDPRQLADLFQARGIPRPAVWVNASNGSNDPSVPNVPNVPNDWLIKPLCSGGGRGVRPWVGGRVSRDCYLQERVEGVPGSVVFVAAGGRSVPLGVSSQLIGDPAFGAEGFRYCGNILAAAGDPHAGQDEAIVGAVSAMADAVAEGFELVGVNGIDFISADGVPYPIEVNPRWCASMELVERAYDLSVFGAHAAACAAGTLPVFDLSQARQGAPAVGKAIVFARRDMTMGDTLSWLEDPAVRDVPHPGERIGEGHPICTVLAEGPDAAACYDALAQRALRIYAHAE